MDNLWTEELQIAAELAGATETLDNTVDFLTSYAGKNQPLFVSISFYIGNKGKGHKKKYPVKLFLYVKKKEDKSCKIAVGCLLPHRSIFGTTSKFISPLIRSFLGCYRSEDKAPADTCDLQDVWIDFDAWRNSAITEDTAITLMASRIAMMTHMKLENIPPVQIYSASTRLLSVFSPDDVECIRSWLAKKRIRRFTSADIFGKKLQDKIDELKSRIENRLEKSTSDEMPHNDTEEA